MNPMTEPKKDRFSSYDEFFAFYLQEHSRTGNRLLHACGTLVGLAVFVWAIATGHYIWALLWIPIGYGLDWSLSHRRQ